MQGFLSDCRKIELLAAEVYRRLAEDGRYAPQLGRLFWILNADELEHARQIEMLMQMPPQELDAIARISAEKLDEAVALAIQMRQRVNAERLSEAEALQLAVDLETRFVRFHVHNSVQFENRALTVLFEELGRADEGHLDLLQRCLQWWQRTRGRVPSGV